MSAADHERLASAPPGGGGSVGPFWRGLIARAGRWLARAAAEPAEAIDDRPEDFASLFENAPVGVYRSTIDGRMLRANRALVRINGYETEAELLAAVRDIAREWYVDGARRAEFQRRVERDGALVGFESEIRRHRTGERIWITEDAWVVRDRAGRPQFYEGTVRDVTEARRHQNELAEKTAALEEQAGRLARLNEEYARARQRAEDANRAKTNFLANMSHELRTPLNAVIGFSDMMRREMLGALGRPRYRDYAEDIHASGQYLLALIGDVLDMARIEAGKHRLEPEAVRLDELMRENARLVEPRALAAGVSVEVADGPTETVAIDPRATRQILLNLLSNAVKFTPSGGRVRLSWRCLPDAVELVVVDTGIGIPPEVLPRLGHPFEQAESALARRHAGTGLGLALSRALAEMHGGALEIASAVGEGTTVTVLLGLLPAPPAPPG